MVKLNRIGIIPARSGSKRIPQKNIVDFNGKPMIAWTIEAALATGLFDRILVSTDSSDIAKVARDCGLEVPFLRDDCADDHSPVSLGTLRALQQVEQELGESYQTVCQLIPNCPLRGAQDIATALETFDRSGTEFQISCFRLGWMNPWWAVRLDADGHPSPLFPDKRNRRSQDLDELYCPTGAIWIANAAALTKAGTFYGPGHTFHPIDWKAGIDIDDNQDLEMAHAASELLARP